MAIVNKVQMLAVVYNWCNPCSIYVVQKSPEKLRDNNNYLKLNCSALLLQLHECTRGIGFVSCFSSCLFFIPL